MNDSFNIVFKNLGLKNFKGYEETFITKAFFQEDSQLSNEFSDLWKLDYLWFWSMWRYLSRVDFGNTDSSFMTYQGSRVMYSPANKLPYFFSESDFNVNNLAYQIVKILSTLLEVQLKSTNQLDSTKN